MQNLTEDIQEKGRFEALYHNVINSVANPLFLKDKDHKWILINDAFCEFLNLDREGLLGKSDYEFFPKHEADIFWEKDNAVLETGKTNVNEESITKEDGNQHTILTSKVRIEDDSGNHYILGTIMDITEMKFDEAQLEKKNILINAQKIEIESLIKETHRHSEQNLHIISKIINTLSNKIDEKQSLHLLTELNNWLSSMMSIHQYFRKSVGTKEIGMPDYIKGLATELHGISESTSLTVTGDPVVLTMRHSIPIGLVISELLLAGKDKSENDDFSVNISVTYDREKLLIDFVSSADIIDEEDAKGEEFGLWDLLQIVVGQVKGTITCSENRREIQIEVTKISANLKVLF